MITGDVLLGGTAVAREFLASDDRCVIWLRVTGAIEDVGEPSALQWRLRRFEDFVEAEWIRAAFTVIDTTRLSSATTVAAVQNLVDSSSRS